MMKALTKLSENAEQMRESKDVWKAKVDSMIEMLKIELYTYMLGATWLRNYPKLI